MAVRSFETGDRRARHQEVLQDALVDHVHALSPYTIIVECVIAVQIRACQPFGGRIIDHRQEIGQDRLIHFLGERLAFAFALLPVPFDAVTEDFVEKYAAGPA